MNTFETLYDLSIELLTARPGSALGRLTAHHSHGTEEAEAIVKAAVLTRAMPSESPTTQWGILRVFMRNLVNRSQAPMTSGAMLRCLDQVTSLEPDDASRTAALINAVAGHVRLGQSLAAVLERGRAPDGCNNYLDWLAERMEEYRQMPVDEIQADRVLRQLHCIALDSKTKIPHLGLALASNLFADLGIRVVGKPDLHVLPTMAGLLGVDQLTPGKCIRELIRMALQDAPRVAANARFSWLTGGLYPRDVDRMMYLMGSDNFRLNGTQQKHGAPKRRAMMLETLFRAAGSPTPTGGPQTFTPWGTSDRNMFF